MLRKFDLCKSPLTGRWLLEASAGTGKTYSLEHLVLRLLVEENVAVNRVLLVTFTNAATNEISERVGALLRRMLARVEHPEARLSDALEEALLSGWNKSNEELAEVFAKAIEDLEDASILTIHKFCQKMLSELSFTRGGDFGQGFSQTDEIARQVVDDFIRRESISLSAGDAMKLVECRDTLQDSLEKIMMARPVVGEIRCDVNEENAPVSQEVMQAFKRFLLEAPERLTALERQARTTTFTGLLVETYRLVNAQPELAASIRERYEALLIDEFQDTDSIQYGIFKTIFFPDEKTPQQPRSIFFVGDPKQAIYSFRMAELETYIGARREIEALPAGRGGVLSLATNFRSAKPLVEFVNAFFAQKKKEDAAASGEAGDSAFLSPDILYEDIASGGSATQLVRIVDGVVHPVPAVSLWMHDVSCDNWEEAKKAAYSAGDVRALEADWIARDIAGLLDGTVYLKKKTVVDGRMRPVRRLCAGDIVILVPGRKNAELYVSALADRGVRAAIASNEDVLKTNEAVEILGVLRAMLSVQSRRTVNAARATRLFGRTLSELRERDDLGVADRMLLEEALARWTTSGPAGALGLVMERRETARRLLKVKQGRSALENYAHVIEILQRQFNALRGAVSVLKWLETQMASSGACPEDRVVRAVAGDDVVRILTMHSSKGLEFPVVYLAMTPSLKEQNRASAFYKGTENGVPFAVAAPTQLSDKYQDCADRRERHEKVRLAYVAMTRASSRLVLPLFWTTNSKWRDSFKHAYCRALLAEDGRSLAGDYNAFCPKFRALCKQLQARVAEVCLQGVPPCSVFGEGLRLAPEFGSPESFVEIRTEPPEEAQVKADENHEPCSALSSAGLPQSWRRSSFTAMARRLAHQGSGDREDYEPGTDALDQIEVGSRDASAVVAGDGFSEDGGAATAVVDTVPPLESAPFLRGAGVGDWLHRQLQRAFSADARGRRREELLAASERLQQAYFMMNRTREEMHAAERLVADRFEALASAPILRTPCNEVISIADIEPERCVPEMQFLLNAPAKGLSMDRLVSRLEETGLSFETDSHDPLRGYVTGSIDLMFAAAGKYWIIDWKSNFLGDGLPSSYTQEAMRSEIMAKNYALQYTIYLVALKRHLLATTDLTEATVWDAIGGAVYVFLRGIDGGEVLDATGRRNGVYVTCPRDAVDALDKLLEAAQGEWCDV